PRHSRHIARNSIIVYVTSQLIPGVAGELRPGGPQQRRPDGPWTNADRAVRRTETANRQGIIIKIAHGSPPSRQPAECSERRSGFPFSDTSRRFGSPAGRLIVKLWALSDKLKKHSRAGHPDIVITASRRTDRSPSRRVRSVAWTASWSV